MATVFDTPDFTTKHPLKSAWTFWVDIPDKSQKMSQKDWQDNLRRIYTVDSVEDFWGVFNNLQAASELPLSANYHLFRGDIKPAWEDPRNTKGGKWAFQFKNRRTDLDGLWQQAALGAIGECFPHAECVCGIVVSIRKGVDRVSVWTANSEKASCMSIGQQFKTLLNVDERVGFQTHESAAVKRSSTTAEKFSC